MNLKAPLEEMLKELPFQVEIRFTRLDGSQSLRVVSCLMPVSQDRQHLEDNADPAILAQNAVYQASKIARKGDVQ